VEIGRWSRIEGLFHEAADLAPAERSAFLDRVCNGDDELRRELESLLAADTPEDELLQAAVDQVLDQLPATSDEKSEPIGRRVGRYKITGLIGKGGMGAVYLAAREDDFHMQVAVKLLKRGTDTETALSRFRGERQILAELQHPNIAHLFDGGATESGLPYFVMEYVDGAPLLEYAASLSVRQGLELFRGVCSAVQYAHQHQVVHRDIKPANILVTREGVPKLLDFGIAKLVDPVLDGATVATLTAVGARLMTPDYASPEQVRAEPVTTATDIYSLGAVLYELLTGQRAHHVETCSPSEIEKEICTHEPKKPSAIAKHLDPDLDNIVLMAMRKEPERRYKSVQDFAEDIDRFLQDLPVKARKESLLYRTRKFLKRKRALITVAATTAAIVLAVVVGLGRFTNPNVGIETGMRSIAVLPLENLSGDKQQDYFADGITNALTNDLARIRALRVISNNSVMSYKDAHRTPPEIAHSLGVETIAEGSVLRAGNRVRINIRLIEALKNRQMLSGSYEAELQDVSVLQSQVARAIVGELRVAIKPEQVRTSLNERVSLDAYDTYLRGRQALSRASVEDVHRSIQFFQRALEIEPRYALAYAGLADSYLSLSGMYMTPREAMAKAKAAALRALEIDPGLADAHISMGVAKGWYEFAWEKAVEELKRAIDLNPSNALAHLYYGSILASVGSYQEGIRELRIAHELDPLSAFVETGLGQIYFNSRQYELAIRQLRSVVESDPNFVHGHMFLGVAFLYTKQFKEAAFELEKAWQMDNQEPQPIAYLAYAHAKLGNYAVAARDLRKLTELSHARYVSGYLFAIVSLGMGSRDAVEWLQKAYDDRDDMLSWLKVDALFDPLRADPRFKVLMRQTGFDTAVLH
jgi:eukaryotic-like serine/threonine-protein kinase